MNLFLVNGDTAIGMEIPQELLIYTRHFVIVLRSSDELLLQDGVKGVRGDG
jgi:hypothetical protein